MTCSGKNMRQLDLNDARTLLVQKTHRKAIHHAQTFKTGRVRYLQRRYVLEMAKRLKKEMQS